MTNNPPIGPSRGYRLGVLSGRSSPEGEPHTFEFDPDAISVSQRFAVAKGQLDGPEIVKVHVTWMAKLRVLEMMILQIDQRVAHVLFPRSGIRPKQRLPTRPDRSAFYPGYCETAQ